MPNTGSCHGGYPLPTWLLLLNDRKRTVAYIESEWQRFCYTYLADFVVTSTASHAVDRVKPPNAYLEECDLPENIKLLNQWGPLFTSLRYSDIRNPSNHVADVLHVFSHHARLCTCLPGRCAYYAHCRIYQGFDSRVNRIAARVISWTLHTIRNQYGGKEYNTYSSVILTEPSLPPTTAYMKRL